MTQEKQAPHICSFDLKKYSRDDQGFYMNCVECGKLHFFDCDTEQDFYDLFFDDDDDD